jgi:hypothetical protein
MDLYDTEETGEAVQDVDLMYAGIRSTIEDDTEESLLKACCGDTQHAALL